ncbi:MAG: hydrogenase formation protein HypD, partial [Methanococcoides sp.]|nr:hydrogenase formation protein HypD [Methanococcoides sp.]MCD4822788.1 hydrogenase formation protein HypD [Methanococcoides sp.]
LYEGCICAGILTARAEPSQCPLFGRRCSPEDPVGPCMVSLEGTCYNWYKYTRNKGI